MRSTGSLLAGWPHVSFGCWCCSRAMVVGFQAELDCSCELGVLLAFMSVVITSFRNHGAREHAEHTDFGCSNALMLTRLEEPADGRRDHGLHEIGWLVKKKTHAVNHLEKRLSAIV